MFPPTVETSMENRSVSIAIVCGCAVCGLRIVSAAGGLMSGATDDTGGGDGISGASTGIGVDDVVFVTCVTGGAVG